MSSTDRFTLANDPPRVARATFTGDQRRQSPLLSGLDCLPGQEDLFATDGELASRASRKIEQPPLALGEDQEYDGDLDEPEMRPTVHSVELAPSVECRPVGLPLTDLLPARRPLNRKARDGDRLRQNNDREDLLRKHDRPVGKRVASLCEVCGYDATLPDGICAYCKCNRRAKP